MWIAEDRFSLVSKVVAGRLIASAGLEHHINSGQLYQWVKKYQEKGLNGLEYRIGRKPKEMKMSPKKREKPSISNEKS